jgi:hypothetical protein
VLTVVTILVGVLAGFAGARVMRRPASSRRAQGLGADAASVARSVGGAIGSRRDLDLPHLQRSTLSEMLRHVRPERGAAAVPAEFRVRLHPDDKATVDQAPGFFRQGLEQALAKAGTEHGWTVPAKLRIDIEADPSRHRGTPAVDARDAASEAPPAAAPAPAPAAPPAAAVSRARLERSDGADHVLGELTTIGRSPESDLQVDDNRVSRRHAVVRRDGERWTLTDEGSSNGTRRNGQRITPTTPIRLGDGDEIGVGPVTFVFRIDPRPGGAP